MAALATAERVTAVKGPPPMRRASLTAAVVLVSALALLPVLMLVGYALLAPGSSTLQLGAEGLEQVVNTVVLVVGVGLIGAVVGTANGWLTACCHFPGRRWLRLAQVLPLAAPAFVLATVLVDLGSRWGYRFHGIGWAVLLLSLTTYTYVFLLSTESFSMSGHRQLEACRSLGVGPWGSFRRVALPLALPSIGAGVALSGMEVVNELGAVEMLGVPTLSRGILQRWQGEGDLQGAVGLALIALVMVSLLVGAERWLRHRSRRWNMGHEGTSSLQWQLSGWRCYTAQLLTVVPPVVSLAIPLTWLVMSLDHLQSDSLEELVALTLRSLGLALAAAVVTVVAAVLLAIARRWLPQPFLRQLTFVAGMGYAIPGTVLALALMLIGGPLGLSPLLLLLWGYSDRFLAVSKGGLDAALERIPPSVDEAATGLGCSWSQVLKRVHLPLLKGPMLVGALLVFVDTVKELPLTFSLRPFDFDTQAVRVYQYAGDERVSTALIPALLIVALGLVAAVALMPSLERLGSGADQS